MPPPPPTLSRADSCRQNGRSDAYFEVGTGNLWDFLYGSAVALLLLNLRWSARMRDLSERVTRFKPVHTFVYFLQYLVLTSILIFPLSVYEDISRAQIWPRTQTFALDGRSVQESRRESGAGGLLACFCSELCAACRAPVDLGRVVTLAFTIFTVLIAPVYIVPIFNKVTRLDDPKIVDPS